MPAEGYTWKTLPDLNKNIQKKYKNVELNEIRILFNTSFIELQKIINKHSNEELFEKKRYQWTGTTSVASSHYEWALKLIKKAKK